MDTTKTYWKVKQQLSFVCVTKQKFFVQPFQNTFTSLVFVQSILEGDGKNFNPIQKQEQLELVS